MKTKWEDYAQRRKINLEMFKSLSYQEYVEWCSIRRVEPVSQDSYEGVQNILVKVPPIRVVTEQSAIWDETSLKKKRKGELVTLCEEHGILFESSDTKRSLIEKLKSLNND